ncbi:MAG: CotH kinase family protein [Treponema sp.]|jgi:spore coat protein CotH|nr:CotH kinase family protein [Treponema sp.]
MIPFFSNKHSGVVKILAVVVLCFAAALIVALFNYESVKAMAKEVLRGSVNPAKLDTGLPVIKITTLSGRPVSSREEYIAADMEILDPDNGANNFRGRVEIRGRGNATWKAPKRPYRLKFDAKTSLFGYEKAKSWVLLANYQDTTLLSNSVAFELGRLFGLPFTPHTVHADMIFNGRYDGNYTLSEQIQIGKGRVEIGGEGSFFVELDSHYDDEPKFRTALLDMPVMIKYPENLADASAYDFIRDALNGLETALFSETFPDSGYRDLIDLDVFVDYIMINEITRNVDIQHPHSVYLYRDGGEDSRIKIGPLWDFDYGFDYNSESVYFGGGVYFGDATGMYYHTVFREGQGERFFRRFFEDPYFRAKYRERWNEKYSGIAAMETYIDRMAPLLEKSHKANSKVWWWNAVDYKKEIERMKDWWRRRIEYLNTEINQF